MKTSLWSGESIDTPCEVSIKIDGVRCFFTDDGPRSRAGKPLYNIPTNHSLTDVEVFTGTWESTVSAVRTKNGNEIDVSYLYSLNPIDDRLLIGEYPHLCADDIKKMFSEVLSKGHEGLIIRTDRSIYKVKSKENYDTKITGVKEGKGKFKGMLGYLETPLGNVGTGFTNKERVDMYSDHLIGETIEVEAMGLTPSGKFRHPRFVRLRFDK